MILVKDAQYRVIQGFPVRRDLRDDEWHQIVRRAYSKHHREVEKLRQQANRNRDALIYLVDLKLKKVNAFEASLSRQQQKNTARQAEETSRQGQTLMTFTIATIIFLPLSFMAAFFAINFEEFPKNSDGSSHLTLAWVSKYLYTWYLDGSVPPLHPSCFEPGPFKSMVCRCLDVDPTSFLSNQVLSMVWPRSVTISSKRADIASQDE
ncbi:uncharacterized protein K444DRAFT_354047 [Hyaloscypha bicolor E]|uniref:Uncharacterized protein n=1 Tax=Hyaloscypha bicolor E TaxID=1095630 RepID=A0A2J6TIS2_9HELO|nr:uncharacterized protein K444DRAFT_354047 [Hyaloscypha bicolor E]PMD62916.1 hypothetical protein K444DRAFT_354047 [Hyaloscypha bicolor E]